ncbi:MAG: TRAP transporter substrate-binding protein [Candidatus Odinarchaeia archaeon]
MFSKKYAILIFMLLLIISLTGLSTGVFAGESKIVLKAGHSQSITHPWHIGMTAIAEKVAEKTNGGLTIDVYPACQLGSEDEMAEAVVDRTLDMSGTTPAHMSAIISETELIELPYLFTSYEHLHRVVRGPVGDWLKNLFEEHGVKILSYFTNAKRSIYNRKHPIYTPDDLKDIKIRVMPGEIQAKTWEALGAKVSPISFSELYTSLQTGVVDAAEPDPNTCLEQKHYEVAPYTSFTEHSIPVRIVIINLNVFNNLPEEYQTALVEAGKEAEDIEWAYDRKLHDEAVQKLLEAGQKINLVNKKSFIEKTESVRLDAVKKWGLEEIYNMIKAEAD